jgi:uncharacterized sporulation protein YeaH/YhbH (DUF444 family)
MPHRIHEDHKDFEDVIAGRKRKALKELIGRGSIFRSRGKNGQVQVPIPKIDIPHIVFGDTGEGVGRGPGKEGQVIGKEPGEGEGGGAGQGEGDVQYVNVDMEEIIRFLKEELKLPDMKPKPTATYEEIKIKYTDIAKTGPESLRHNRRTMKEALKRTSAQGTADNLIHVPGYADPKKIVIPINTDRRYRQYREIKIPSSNAVIIFARDWSGSMDQVRCDIVSDMCWWIDCYIRKFYDKVQRVYVGHDTIAKEVSEDHFYRYRMGGGTNCSSALKLISEWWENRFKPQTWNIYLFYFTDGDNWDEDNNVFIKMLKERFGADICNLVGITQILSYSPQNSVLEKVNKALESGILDSNIVKTTEISSGGTPDKYGWVNPSALSEDDRNAQIMRAIKDLLGKGPTAKIA